MHSYSVFAAPILYQACELTKFPLPMGSLRGGEWAAFLNLHNRSHTIFWKAFVCRHHRQVVYHCRGNDKTVTGIIVDLRQLNTIDTNIDRQRKHSQVVVFDRPHKPLPGREWQLQLSLRDFKGNFKCAYCRHVHGRTFSNLTERFRRKLFISGYKPEQRAGIENHRFAEGHSSAESDSTGS